MNSFLVACLLATVALSSAQYGYGGYGGWYSQPPTSQSYSGAGHHYGSQPVGYTAPALTFNPPRIQYTQPSVTYSTPSRVPVPVLNQNSYGGGSTYGASSGYMG